MSLLHEILTTSRNKDVHISSDNKHILTCCINGYVDVFDLESGKIVRQFHLLKKKYHITKASSVFHGEYIISIFAETYECNCLSLQITNWKDGSLLRKETVQNISKICVSHDGKYVIYFKPKTLHVTDFATGKTLNWFELPIDNFDKIYMTNDNQHLIVTSYSNDYPVSLVSLITGKMYRRIGRCESLWASPEVCGTSNSKYILFSFGNTVTLWNLCRNIMYPIAIHNKIVTGICVTPSQPYQVISISGAEIRFTHFNNCSSKSVFVQHNLSGACVSPNGMYIVCSCFNGYMLIFRSPKYMARHQLQHEWAQVLLHQSSVFRLFEVYPGLLRLVGTQLLRYC